MSFSLGCAVWSFKGWVGSLYPPGSKAADFLNLYSRRLTAVEGNSTFYAVPDRDTVTRWRDETPHGFRFCLKLPRDLSHGGLLEPNIPAALRFLEHMEVLGDRLGPLFLQLPPGYGIEQLSDLEAFLTAWPRDRARLAVEVRNRDYFREPHGRALNEMLEGLGVGRVQMDSRPVYEGPEDPRLEGERHKPRLPLQPVLTAPFSVVRFVSHPVLEANQPYLDEWVIRVDRWLRQGIDLYFFVHCPVEAQSVLNLRHFQRMLEQRGAPVPPLPWDEVEKQQPTAAPSKSAQLRLF